MTRKQWEDYEGADSDDDAVRTTAWDLFIRTEVEAGRMVLVELPPGMERDGYACARLAVAAFCIWDGPDGGGSGWLPDPTLTPGPGYRATSDLNVCVEMMDTSFTGTWVQLSSELGEDGTFWELANPVIDVLAGRVGGTAN